MQKHKGLLRVDLRGNAGSFSGVLQMLPKQPAGSCSLLSSSQVLKPLEGQHAGVVARLTSGSSAAQQTAAGQASAITPAVISCKGLVPVMTTDGHTPLQQENTGSSRQTEKENAPGNQAGTEQQPREFKGKAGRGPAAVRKPPHKAKHADQPSAAQPDFFEFKLVAESQRSVDPSTASSDFLEFGFDSQHELQFQSIADLTDVQHSGELGQQTAYTDGQNQHFLPSARMNDKMGGSASFGLWARPQHDSSMQGAADYSRMQPTTADQDHAAQHDSQSAYTFAAEHVHNYTTSARGTLRDKLEDLPDQGCPEQCEATVQHQQDLQQPHQYYAARTLHSAAATRDNEVQPNHHLAASALQSAVVMQKEEAEPRHSQDPACHAPQRHQAPGSKHKEYRPEYSRVASAVHSRRGKSGLQRPMIAAVGRKGVKQRSAAQQEQTTQHLHERGTQVSSKSGLQWSSEQPITVCPSSPRDYESEGMTAGLSGTETGKRADMSLLRRSSFPCKPKCFVSDCVQEYYWRVMRLVWQCHSTLFWNFKELCL